MSKAPEWLDELSNLARHAPEDNGLLTVMEMCEPIGRNQDHVRKLLAQAKKMGLLVSGQKRTQRLDGQMVLVPAYRVEAPKKSKR